MSFLTVFLIAVGLSMDAFAVSITLGIHAKVLNLKKLFLPSVMFGVFQGLMPIIGWYFGLGFRSYIEKFSPAIAFILLSIIGIKMIMESRSEDEDNKENYDKFSVILVLAVATSIDALAVGISFSILKIAIFLPALIITLTTFIFSLLGIILGNKLSNIRKDFIEIAGGLILIFIGLKIIFPQISHLFN